MKRRFPKKEMTTTEMVSFITSCAQKVSSKIGFGATEAIYQCALVVEMRHFLGTDFTIEEERIVPITYRGQFIGSVRSDIVVTLPSRKKILVELKSLTHINEQHVHQTAMYMRRIKTNTGVLVLFDQCDPDLKEMLKNSDSKEEVQQVAVKLLSVPKVRVVCISLL